MLDTQDLQGRINQTPAPKVSKAYIEQRIGSTRFERFSPTVTMCEITLDSGFSVRGESACVNVENYDQEIGERISYDNAFSQLWPLFGFLLAEEQFADSTNKAA